MQCFGIPVSINTASRIETLPSLLLAKNKELKKKKNNLMILPKALFKLIETNSHMGHYFKTEISRSKKDYYINTI